MERATARMLRIGAWYVNPALGQISRDGETARVETRTMRLLLCLAEHAGEVVSIDELLTQVWSDVTVSPDSVYQAVTSLRRLLGDDPKQPSYIATVPRLGYRMVAKVGPWTDGERSGWAMSEEESPTSRAEDAGEIRHPGFRGARFTWAAGAVLALTFIVVIVFLFRGKVASSGQSISPAMAAQPQKSVAVLPFLDLTEGMKEEEFADGMTEELIDKLSKIPDFRVPAATSSFYFKGKQIPVAEIAQTLGVAYVLDGSVRKSAARFRVAARLVRADHGYVIWSETYDRPLDDKLMVQDDIAGEVAKALRASIGARMGASSPNAKGL
ncbi:MAG TPA: winged helix-turn-helix domain-containing protein [Candidatus Dormibacteraeota bacterium]|nr:winged helix-turn-helix domain-containing protein [Candidatus Dormibacteraeota bacterium]